jgi:hypothetical protein
MIDLCIVDGVPGCAIDCYPLEEWEVVSKAEVGWEGAFWPTTEQQYEAVKSGAEALVWAYNAWFGVRRKR